MTIRNNYPPFYDGNKTIDIISKTQQVEIDDQFDRIQEIFNNNFVNTADVVGVRQYEAILKILPLEGVETLEYRKLRIIARLTQRPPFTRLFLINYLDLIFGRDQYVLDFIPMFKLLIRVNNIAEARFLAGILEIRKFIPANVELEITELRRTWGDVTEIYKTWGPSLEPNELYESWDWRLNDSWNSTPEFSWYERYVDMNNLPSDDYGGAKGFYPYNTWGDISLIPRIDPEE